MKFKRHIELEHGLSEIDITPLINVFFLLLLFYILTANFVTQPGIRVNLPKALTSEIVKNESIEIILTGDNAIYVNNKSLSKEELKKFIEQFKTSANPVLIKADKKVSLGRIVEIWDLCRSLGLSQVNIATNQG